LLVRGATIVLPSGRFEAELAVKDGKVAALGQQLGDAAEVVDARGLHLLPGPIDAHVHFREPGLTHKEDFATGTGAAALGGITAVFDMPNTSPPVATTAAFEQKRELVEPSARVDFGLFGILLQENVEEVDGIAAAGAIGFKLFMGETTGNNPCPDDPAIFAHFRRIAKLGSLAAVHAENNAMLQTLKTELRAAGRRDARAHLDSRPWFVEAEAVGRATAMAAGAGNRLHVVHVSTRQGLERVRLARREGGRVTCEALISHLLLDDSAYQRHGNLAMVNPPIREPEHVQALWDGLRAGEIDLVATDHAPHTLEEQTRDDVWQGVGGFGGVELMLPLMLTQATAGKLTLEDVVRLTSQGPARVYGLYPGKGSLTIGSDADFVLVDLVARWIVDQARLHAKHRISPFHGWELTGRPTATFVRGRAVMREGELLGSPSGRLVRPLA
jgi:dihydroorotase